jgi:hypothetical protein
MYVFTVLYFYAGSFFLSRSVSALFWLSLDPVADPGAWKWTKINKLVWFPAFQKGVCALIGLFLIYYLL